MIVLVFAKPIPVQFHFLSILLTSLKVHMFHPIIFVLSATAILSVGE